MFQETCCHMPDVGASASAATVSNKKLIRFEKCIGCSDIGVTCSGPNLLVLTIPELRGWVNRWREYYKLSINKCAAAWDMPEGTVARFLSSADTDFRFATIQGIIQGIIRYGQPADYQQLYNPCPATSFEIQEQVATYEKQLAEKTEECASLTVRKLERADEYAERMADQRESFEKHLSEKTDTIDFFKNLSEKMQKDIEKAEARSENYLQRIDVKNSQIEARDDEIRKLNSEILRISSAHNEEVKALIDRILRMSDLHTTEMKHFLNLHEK